MPSREDEQARAYRAQQALDEFVGPAIEDMRVLVVEALEGVDPTDVLRLQTLAIRYQIIREIEQEIRNHIDTGKLAARHLP
jgi:hypothetical protein